MNSNQGILIYVKLILTALFWGGTFVAGRKVAEEVPPASSAFLRFAIASVFLLALTHRLERRFPRPDRIHLLGLLILGLTGVSGYNIFFFKGLTIIQASRAALIIATCPIFITIASAAFFGERLSPVRLLGIVISITGAMVVISRGSATALLSGGLGLGELYIFGCVLCWTAYSIVGKPMMVRLSPLTLVAYSSVIGTLGLLPPALAESLHHNFTDYSATSYIAIAYLGICGTVIGFTWFYQAVREIGPTRAGLFINFVPVWAIILAALLLNEKITLSLIAGTILVITGVYLTNKKQPTRSAGKEQ